MKGPFFGHLTRLAALKLLNLLQCFVFCFFFHSSFYFFYKQKIFKLKKVHIKVMIIVNIVVCSVLEIL